MVKDIFLDCCIYLFPGKLTKKRLYLFETQICKSGGKTVSNCGTNSEVTHIIVEETCDVNSLPSNNWKSSAHIVGTKWISDCIKHKKLIDTLTYKISTSDKKRPIETFESLSTDESPQKKKKPIQLEVIYSI